MSNEREIIRKTENMIDELKSVCSLNGIGNSPSEYKVISQIFLYKYLNDKFIHEVRRVDKKFNNDSTIKEVEKYLSKIEPKDYSLLLMRMNPNVAKIKKEYMISYLFNNQNTNHPEFYELFDNALLGISTDNINIFSVKTGSKEKIKLFDNLSQYITESDKKNRFFKAIINKLVGFSFEKAFEEKYDFFATIFEYLIKDYNKDFGKYAEYYTPNSIARIIARILAPNPTQNVTLYDPAAGSGTLLLALAHQIGEDNCTIYSQDISQKSNEFLRLNLILNNLVHSLGNAIHGDTLLSPAHLNNEKNRLAQFDYIVSNPPFKTDFSETRDQLDSDKFKDRFFAGVPKVPNKDKDKMAIYLLFIQHIIYSLKEDGKAAIVVPTGFITAKQGIEFDIRKKLISDNLIDAVISMPSNIFANTGTSVSILFITKNKVEKSLLLVDASNMGTSFKSGKIKKTVLSKKEQEEIIDVMINKKCIRGRSILVNYDKIKDLNFDFSASLYFPINYYKNMEDISVIKSTLEGFKSNLDNFKNSTETEIYSYLGILNKISLVDKKLNHDLTLLEIPKGWEIVKLGSLFEFEKGKIPQKIFNDSSEKRTPYLTIETLNGSDNQFVNIDDGNFVKDEVLMVMDGAASGTVFQGKEGILGSTLSKLRIKKGINISNEFLYYILKSLEKEISLRNTGSTVPHANKLFIKNISISLPKDKETLDSCNEYFKQVRKITLSFENVVKTVNEKNKVLFSTLINGQAKF